MGNLIELIGFVLLSVLKIFSAERAGERNLFQIQLLLGFIGGLSFFQIGIGCNCACNFVVPRHNIHTP